MRHAAAYLAHRWRLAKDIAQIANAVFKRREAPLAKLVRRQAQRVRQQGAIKLNQHRALKHQSVAIEVSACPGNLFALDFNIVAGTEGGVNTELLQPLCYAGANHTRDIGERRRRLGARKNQLPAENARPHHNRTAAGHAPRCCNIVGAHPIEMNFAFQNLMATNDGAWREVLKAQGGRRSPRAMADSQRLRNAEIFARRAQSGVDDAQGRHVTPVTSCLRIRFKSPPEG